MALEKIIILDDELIIRKTLEEQLRRRRYSVASAGTIAETHKLLLKDQFDLIFLDVRLPDGNGTDLLEAIKLLPHGPLPIVMTGYGTIESAVACMKAGAFDYIIKPFSIEEIDILIKKAESYTHLLKVNHYFSADCQQDETALIGTSPIMQELHTLIKKVAATEATVLITGENGTGKELVAQELHRLSARSKAPFIRVNCAAISENLIESEFFGHEKGSFTGATQRREGRFELAHTGTLLLDEVSEVSIALQAKLLRVLQEKEFERVGGNKTLSVNVRVLATTNRKLDKCIAEGSFREDLFYRLNVFPIQVPPLRARKEDIALLATTFLQRFSRKHGKKIPHFTDAALACLHAYPFPGNVRELQNIVERAVILSDEERPVDTPLLGIVGPVKAPKALKKLDRPVSAKKPKLNRLKSDCPQPLLFKD